MTDDFTRDVFRIILARIAQAKGFTFITEFALEILIDVVIERLSDFSRNAASITAHCGRTDTNGLDIFAALHRYHETTETLNHYLKRSDPFPPFDFLVDPYPLPRLPSFYSNDTYTVPVPFRCNTTVITDLDHPHIPLFFPKPPIHHTSDRPQLYESASVKRRESHQQRVKQAVGQISAEQSADAPHAIAFGCALDKLVTDDILTTPASQMMFSLFPVEGIQGRQDPEFLDMRPVTWSKSAE
jgi:hypothetical protein